LPVNLHSHRFFVCGVAPGAATPCHLALWHTTNGREHMHNHLAAPIYWQWITKASISDFSATSRAKINTFI